MDLKDMLVKDYLQEIYEHIKLGKVNFEEFNRDNCILVIKSASIDIFKKFILKVREINPNICIYIITHSRDKDVISKICNKSYEIIEYLYDDAYQLSKLKEKIEYLKCKNIDKSILLYNNRYGMGFDNIEEILIYLDKYPIYAFNCYNELLKISNPALHIESLRIFNAMCTWFWEYMELTEMRNLK